MSLLGGVSLPFFLSYCDFLHNVIETVLISLVNANISRQHLLFKGNK